MCDNSNIAEYLFEMSTNHSSSQAAKNFDFIDVIFIEGDANLRPWSKRAQKVKQNGRRNETETEDRTSD